MAGCPLGGFCLLRAVKFDFSLRILGGMSDFSRRTPGRSADAGLATGVLFVLFAVFDAFFLRKGIVSNVFDLVITGRGILDDDISLFFNIERGIFDDFISSKSVCVDMLVHDLRIGSDKLVKLESKEESGLTFKSDLGTAGESQTSYDACKLLVSILRSNGCSMDFERTFTGLPVALVFLLSALGVVLSQTPL